MARATDLSSLAGGGGGASPPPRQSRALTARGLVAVAPASEDDSMQVVVTTVTRKYGETIPAGNWAPRGSALPSVGADCLVVYDDVGDAFVPVWAGTTALPAIPTTLPPSGPAGGDLGGMYPDPSITQLLKPVLRLTNSTAQPWDFVLTSNTTVTLPTAPPNGTMVGVNGAATINVGGGSDLIFRDNSTPTSTSIGDGETLVLIYTDVSGNYWRALSNTGRPSNTMIAGMTNATVAYGPGTGEPLVSGGAVSTYDPQVRRSGARYITPRAGAYLCSCAYAAAIPNLASCSIGVKNFTTGFMLSSAEPGENIIGVSGASMSGVVIATAAGQSLGFQLSINQAVTLHSSDGQTGNLATWFSVCEIN